MGRVYSRFIGDRTVQNLFRVVVFALSIGERLGTSNTITRRTVKGLVPKTQQHGGRGERRRWKLAQKFPTTTTCEAQVENLKLLQILQVILKLYSSNFGPYCLLLLKAQLYTQFVAHLITLTSWSDCSIPGPLIYICRNALRTRHNTIGTFVIQ